MHVSTQPSPLPAFDDPDLLVRLEAAGEPELDTLPFGVVRLDAEGRAIAYNAHEQRAAGLAPERVLGRPFFATVAPCANIPEIAGRLAGPAPVDIEVDFVFALRLRPVPVRLRLLKGAGGGRSYMLVLRV